MYSFEGEHRRRPNVSLSGASKLMDKNAFLDKLKKEREARENNKKREVAAVRIQSFIRGCLCRIRVNYHSRSAYDIMLSSIKTSLDRDAAKVLCMKMVRMYRFSNDAQRLMSLCSLLVRHSSALLQWLVQDKEAWTHILPELLHLALEALITPVTAGAAPLSHAGPLRLLEVVTQPTSQAAMSSEGNKHIFDVLTPLIKKGYFRCLVRLLVMKVPAVDERGGVCSAPLADSLLGLLLYPVYAAVNCSRSACQTRFKPAQHYSWVSRDNDVITPSETNVAPSAAPSGTDSSVSPYTATSSPSQTSPETMQAEVSDTPAETFSSRKREKEDSLHDVETLDTKLVKYPREDTTPTLVSCFGSTPSTSVSPEASISIAKSNTENSSFATDSNKLLCHAFSGPPVAVPANYVNLTLYKLVEELLASSGHSQVHNWLVVRVSESGLLLRRPADTHALVQASHFVMLDSLKESDTDAPAKLTVLLTLIPIKTRLTTSSLHLYLQSCRNLTSRTVHFLPAPGDDLRHGQDYDSDSDDYEEEDDDDDDEMDVDTIPADGISNSHWRNVGSSYMTKSNQRPAAHLIDVGKWCLAHINSPEYVSWLLDEVEAGDVYREAVTQKSSVEPENRSVESDNVDREVLTEFCGLTHTLLTAPCLSLFQCRLLYGVVGRHRMQRAMWQLLTSLYPSSWLGPQNARTRGNSRLLASVSRGSALEPRDRDTLVPVLASFVTTLIAVLATLHDSELVVTSPDYVVNALKGNSGDESSSSNCAFNTTELVTISATLKDVCVGLAELAHPDTRASNMTDAAYKEIWDHCFKCCVDVVRQLYLRDTRRLFCPENHWLTDRISLPELPQTASYRSLLRNRTSRRRAFLPARWKTKAQLMSDSGQSQLSTFEKVRATVLQELPFVFSFTDRAEVFLRLVEEDRTIAHGNSAFNVGPNISIRVRRSHLYEDSFEKLSPENESNMRLSLRVQIYNVAGAQEAGVDGGGLFREFLSTLLISAFDPNRGFFLMTNENTLYPNPSAHLLHPDFQSHYYFIGRLVGKALYEKLLVEIPLAGFFLSKILSRKGFSIEFHHLDSLDPELCRNLLYLKTYKGDVQDLNLDFTVLVSELGHNRVVELVPDGSNIPVTADNRIEYIYRVADFKLNKQIAKQCCSFRKGLHDVVAAEWLQLFNWRELQTMISGTSNPFNIQDLREHCCYNGEYNDKHKTIKLFWQVVEQLDQKQCSQLLKFVTSCSLPPLLGFKDLAPTFCIQPSGDEQRLPTASTCMNLLKLPKYSDPITLKEKLVYAITSNAGFELS